LISFDVQDFNIGPAYCVGTSQAITTTSGSFTDGQGSLIPSPYGFINTLPDGQMIAGQYVGTPCTSLTITNQPNILSPYFGLGNQVLFLQTNALGGFITNGFADLPSVSIINQALPFNGISVPQLAPVLSGNPADACMVPTYWANGTQIPYSYLASHGPLVLPSVGFYPWLSGLIGYLGVNWGCRYDNAAYPNDVGNNGYGNFTNFNNPDFWGITAMALNGTATGSYTFQICPTNAIVTHCLTFGLNVVNAPVLYLTAAKTVSFKHSKGKLQFFAFWYNPSATVTEYVQTTATGIGSLGDTIVLTTPVEKLTAGFFSFNLSFPTATLKSSYIGETFTFTFTTAVGTDSTNLDGTSTQHIGPSSFTVTVTK